MIELTYKTLKMIAAKVFFPRIEPTKMGLIPRNREIDFYNDKNVLNSSEHVRRGMESQLRGNHAVTNSDSGSCVLQP